MCSDRFDLKIYFVKKTGGIVDIIVVFQDKNITKESMLSVTLTLIEKACLIGGKIIPFEHYYDKSNTMINFSLAFKTDKDIEKYIDLLKSM